MLKNVFLKVGGSDLGLCWSYVGIFFALGHVLRHFSLVLGAFSPMVGFFFHVPGLAGVDFGGSRERFFVFQRCLMLDEMTW